MVLALVSCRNCHICSLCVPLYGLGWRDLPWLSSFITELRARWLFGSKDFEMNKEGCNVGKIPLLTKSIC
jgi:hypothetical protein